MNSRALTFWVSGVVVGVLLGLGAATFAASAGTARRVERPRTLLAGKRRIYAFALGAHRITWITRTHMRGRYPGCEMYVRPLQAGRTLRAPLPSAGCGVKPPRNFAAQRPVLASGVAAWVKGSSCGNIECFWQIATITGGEATARVVAAVDVGCPPPACGLRHRVGKSASGVPPPFPHPALVGHGNLLVYSTSTAYIDVAQNIDQVRRIVGRRTVRVAVPSGLGDTGDIERLAVGGGAVEVDSTVLDAGDGCGCLASPAWSPDGSQIAYVRRTPSSPVLAMMNADGSGRHDLSSTQHANGRPVWSPDGKQLAYAALGPQPEAIAVVNADGSGAHEIGLGANPAWSPDGSKIAFASPGCSAAGGSISVMNPDGTNVQPLASFTSNPTCVGGIAWSPDGTRIAFFLNGRLEVMDADGGNPHPLTNSGTGDNPSWSPDSSQIAFNTYDGVWEIGADGTGLRQLTQGPDAEPSWSPDGKTIVFSSDRNNPYNEDESYFRFPELYLVGPDGNNLRPLSFTKPAAFERQTTFYAASGKRLPTFPGVPTLADKVAAVGSTGPSGGHEITLFNAATGAQLAVVKVVGDAAEFEIAGAHSHWIVYRLGATIFALNLVSRKAVLLTRAPADPVGLSVVGRRVAWAENINGHGRIRSVDLPN